MLGIRDSAPTFTHLSNLDSFRLVLLSDSLPVIDIKSVLPCNVAVYDDFLSFFGDLDLFVLRPTIISCVSCQLLSSPKVAFEVRIGTKERGQRSLDPRRANADNNQRNSEPWDTRASFEQFGKRCDCQYQNPCYIYATAPAALVILFERRGVLIVYLIDQTIVRNRPRCSSETTAANIGVV